MKQKYTNIDPYYGVYDTQAEALTQLTEIGDDGRQVAIYSRVMCLKQ